MITRKSTGRRISLGRRYRRGAISGLTSVHIESEIIDTKYIYTIYIYIHIIVDILDRITKPVDNTIENVGKIYYTGYNQKPLIVSVTSLHRKPNVV